MPDKPIIIGFMGLAGAGKTTAARAIQSCFPINSVILPFAAPLKTAVRDLFKFSPEQMYGDHKEIIDPRWGVSPRQVLQKLGTDCVRNMIKKDFWVCRMREEIRNLATNKFSPLIIIDDVRFKDEAGLVLEEGDPELSRLVLVRGAYLEQPPPGTHESENPPAELAELIWTNDLPNAEQFMQCVITSDLVRGLHVHYHDTPHQTYPRRKKL